MCKAGTFEFYTVKTKEMNREVEIISYNDQRNIVTDIRMNDHRIFLMIQRPGSKGK